MRALLIVLLLALPAQAQVLRVVVAGDSIAAGDGVTSSRRHFTMLLPRLSRGRLMVLNVSRGGATIAPGGPWPPLSPSVLSFSTGVLGGEVLVMLGVNDFLSDRPLDDVAASYRALLRVPAGLHEAIVCVTPIWLAGEDTRRNALGLALEDYRQVIRDVCPEYGGRVIEGRPLIPESPSYYADGSLHPNDAGNRYLAKNLWAALEALP